MAACVQRNRQILEHGRKWKLHTYYLVVNGSEKRKSEKTERYNMKEYRLPTWAVGWRQHKA